MKRAQVTNFCSGVLERLVAARALERLEVWVLVYLRHVSPGVIIVCKSGVATLESTRNWPPALVSLLMSLPLARRFELFVAVYKGGRREQEKHARVSQTVPWSYWPGGEGGGGQSTIDD